MSIFTPRRTFARATALAAAAGFVLTGLVAPAGAATDDPSDLIEGCDDAPSASSKFFDYSSLTTRQKDVVDCLSSGYKGDRSSTDYVLQGSGGRVRFDETVSRAQFAAILNRVGDYIGLPAFAGDPDNPTFADVSPGSFFFGEIEELYARGLTKGAGNDVNDVDNDGNTSELVYKPAGSVTYGQILAFTLRLLTDGAGYSLPTNQSHNESNLDCGFFAPEHDMLDNAGFLRSFNIPSTCPVASPRGLVFDLIAVSLDHAVEKGHIDNPFVDAPGSVAMASNKSTAVAGDVIELTVTVVDADGQPANGAQVEIFAVNPSDAFDGSGEPKNPGNASIGGNGKFGTGNSSGVLDNSDPATNAQGKLTTTISTTGASGVSFDVYAFIGDIGDSWGDVQGSSGQTSPKVTVTFTAVPADLVITSSADGWPLKYGSAEDGDDNIVSITVVDADGNPIEEAGQPVVAELFRNNNGNGEIFFTRFALTTNSSGVATWNAPAAPDPSGASGDQTADRFKAAYDANGNGLADDALKNSSDLIVQWRDLSRAVPANATITLPNENSAKGDLMGSLRQNGKTELVRVFVTNVYGDPADGAHVQLRRSVPVSTGTTSGGQIIFSVQAPDIAAAHAFTALVDTAGDGATYTPGVDVSATSVTGDSDVTIQWVNEGPVIPTSYSNLSIAGREPATIFAHDAATTRVRLFNDGNDKYVYGTTLAACNDGTPEISQTTFQAAIDADVEADDVLDVTYQPSGGQSCWVLQVNSSGGGPVV